MKIDNLSLILFVYCYIINLREIGKKKSTSRCFYELSVICYSPLFLFYEIMACLSFANCILLGFDTTQRNRGKKYANNIRNLQHVLSLDRRHLLGMPHLQVKSYIFYLFKAS